MTNKTEERTVIVSATCFADAKSAIELGALLAGSMDAVLNAYLVEDAALYTAAKLPFTRVITLGNEPQPVSPEAMVKAFQRDAKAYRQQLQLVAQTRNLNWTFEIQKGPPGALIPPKMKQADYIVLGYQQLQKSRGEVLALFGEKEFNPAFLQLAETLSRSLSVSLHVVVFTDAQDDKMELSQEHQNSIRQLADRITVVGGDVTKKDFMNLVQKTNPSAIVAANGIIDEIGMNLLIAAGRCPLVIATS